LANSWCFSVVNGIVTDEIGKNHTECSFGRWYYGEGMKLYKNNSFFKALEPIHKELHEKINANLDCIKSGGCAVGSGRKDEVIKRFESAEEDSNKLFSLIDPLYKK